MKVLDKYDILNMMYDEMNDYRGEVRRHQKIQTRGGNKYYNYTRFCTCVDIFYQNECPSLIMRELDDLISDGTTCTPLFKGLKERLLANELIHNFLLPSLTMRELVE